MSKSRACSLTFIKYYVDNIKFERNINFDPSKKVRISYDIDSNILNLDDTKAEVKLFVNIFKDVEEDNKPFEFELEITGVFAVENVNDKLLLEQNTIAILYPFARALISTYTANANVPPLILPPINVIKYIESKKNKSKEQT